MSNRMSSLSGAEVMRALERAGFRQVSQKGSHTKLTIGQRVVIVPIHPIIAKGTLASILRQAGLTKEEFIALLR